eukprot:4350337-Pyramimonas_sp.AAC.1
MKGTRHTATHIATHEGHEAAGGERRRRRNKVVGALDTPCKRIKADGQDLLCCRHNFPIPNEKAP